MAFEIKDASTGNKAKVTKEGHLTADCTTHTLWHHINHDHENAYNCYFGQSATAANDCIFYASNDNDDDLMCGGTWLAVQGKCEVYARVGDKGTRNNATVLTPTNINAGSGKAADGTFEKGNDLDGGAATLTGGRELYRLLFPGTSGTTDCSKYYNFEGDIILSKNETLTLWCNLAAVGVTGTLVFGFHPHE